MKIKALTSFSGKLTMAKDEEMEYGNEAVLRDLLQAGYIEEISGRAGRGGKKNEGKRNQSE